MRLRFAFTQLLGFRQCGGGQWIGRGESHRRRAFDECGPTGLVGDVALRLASCRSFLLASLLPLALTLWVLIRHNLTRIFPGVATLRHRRYAAAVPASEAFEFFRSEEHPAPEAARLQQAAADRVIQ